MVPYSVDVSVDELNPSPGDVVNFTITAITKGNWAVIDQQVAVELTDGLSVSDTPTYASGDMGTLDAPASVSYSNGVFNIGTLKRSDWNDGRHSVTLPVSVSNTAVVNEQCLTATISGNPPPGHRLP